MSEIDWQNTTEAMLPLSHIMDWEMARKRFLEGWSSELSDRECKRMLGVLMIYAHECQ